MSNSDEKREEYVTRICEQIKELGQLRTSLLLWRATALWLAVVMATLVIVLSVGGGASCN